MQRYIDNETRREILSVVHMTQQEEAVENILNNIPAVDFAPVIHAHWTYNFQYQDGDYCYTCSLCGRYEKVISKDAISTMPYCHCGAKMDEEAER